MKSRVAVSGEATVRLGDFPVATITAGAIPIEAGVRLNPDGTLSPEVWTAGNPIDIDIHVSTAVPAGLLSPVLLGEAFSFLSFEAEGDEFVLVYVAPVEPEPKPNRDYKGIIGRPVTELGPRAEVIRTRTLGTTWEAGNLTDKVGHIFMVMMENRSFDHVLGYLAAPPIEEDSGGLSADTTAVTPQSLASGPCGCEQLGLETYARAGAVRLSV